MGAEKNTMTKHKTIIIFTLMLVLTIYSASAISSNMTGIEPNNIIHWYRFENDLTDSGTINAPLTNFGATAYDSPSFANEGTYSFNSATTGLYTVGATGDGVSGRDKFTVGGYLNVTDYSQNGGYSLFGIGASGCGVYYTFAMFNKTRMNFQAFTSNGFVQTSDLPLIEGEKALWVAIYNGTNVTILKNGLQVDSFLQTGTLDNGCGGYNFFVGAEPTFNSYPIGQFDDWFFYNDSITSSQVSEWAEIPQPLSCPADGSTLSGENILEQSCTFNQWTLSANTTLDCNGFTLTKNGTASTVFLSASSNANVTIKNCVFQSYGQTRSGNTITMSGNNTRLENNFFNETSLVQMNTANFKFISNNTWLNPFANASSLTGIQSQSLGYFSNNTLIITKPSTANNVAGSGTYAFGSSCTMENNNVQILNTNETNFNFQSNQAGTIPSNCGGNILIQNNNFSSLSHSVNTGGNGFENFTQNIIIRNNNYECRWFLFSGGQSNSTAEIYNNNFNVCPNFNNNTRNHNQTISLNGFSFSLNTAVPSQNYSTSYKIYNNNFNGLSVLSVSASGTTNSSFRSNVEFYNNTINFQGNADEDTNINLMPTRFIFTSSGSGNLSVHDNYIRMRTPENLSWIGIQANRIISAQAFVLGNTTPILNIYDNDFDVEGIKVTLYDDIGFNDQTYYPNVYNNNWINPNMRLYLTSGTGYPANPRVSQVVGTEMWNETTIKVLSNVINNQSQSWTNRFINGSGQIVNEIIFNNFTGSNQGRTNNTIMNFNILNAPNDDATLTGNTYVNNYWLGFSENCTDANDDGICDSSYTIGTITDLFPLKYAEVCTPDYYCSNFLSCNINNTNICTIVLDTNLCGTPYPSNASDFNTNCTYVQTGYNPTYTVEDASPIVVDNFTKFTYAIGTFAIIIAVAIFVLIVFLILKNYKK